jgi:hypothetical protein
MIAERMTTLRTTLASLRGLSVILLAVAALAALIVWVAPEERTLGAGTKWVYVHVALTWTGMTGLIVAGVLGALVVLGRERWLHWAHAAGAVGLGFLSVGAVISGIAALVNWGGIALDEPRLNATLQIIVASFGVVVLAGTGLAARWKGLLFALLPVFMVASLTLTPLILHPRSPIWTSTSPGIQATFVSLYALSVLAGAGLTVRAYAALTGGAR